MLRDARDHFFTHLLQLAETYGDVFSLQLGQEWMVVLNGPRMLKEALVNKGESVADRPKLQLNMDASHGLGEGITHKNNKLVFQFSTLLSSEKMFFHTINPCRCSYCN